MQRTATTTETTLTTTDQAAQQIQVLGVIASRHLLIACQTSLYLVEQILTNQGRYRNGNPFFRRGLFTAAARSHRLQGRFAFVGRFGAPTMGINRAAIGRIGKNTSDAGHIPASASNLQDQLIMGIVTHGSIRKFYGASVTLPFFQNNHLMHVVTRQSIWGCHQHTLKFGHRGCIAQPIQTGAIQPGPTVALVSKNMLGRQLPALRRDMGLQAVQLLLNRLQKLILSRTVITYIIIHWNI